MNRSSCSLPLSLSTDDDSAFSITHSEEGLFQSGWQHASSCFLCARKFTHFGLHRHHCRFCGRSVCDLHSSKRRPSPTGSEGMVRICDSCEKAMVGHQVTEEYMLQISELRERLRVVRSHISIRAGELEDISCRLRELEVKKECEGQEFARKEKEMAERVRSEERVTATYEKVMSSLKAALMQSSSAETMCSHTVSEKLARLASLEGEVTFLNTQIAEGNAKADALHKQMQGRIAKAKLPELLCDTCHRNIAVHSFISDRETTIQSLQFTSLHRSAHSLPERKSCKADCSVF